MILLVMAAVAAEPSNEDARRLAAILDYVAADYAVAVSDGKITSEAEYAEQIGFLDDAAELAGRLPTSAVHVTDRIAFLNTQVEALASPQLIRSESLDLRGDVLEAYDVVLAPPGALSRDEAARLYAEHCASCHGATGNADGPAAAGLDPAPRNFRDPSVLADLTPARGYNALTDGVKGTAMVSYAHLSPSERWSLASYVFTLGHDAATEERGAALADAGRIEAPPAAELAGVGDAALATDLAGAERDDAVAWIRGVAAFQQEGAAFASARDGLDDALVALRVGDRPEARRRAGEAYLSGFEPHEAALRQASPSLVASVEEVFLLVRSEIDAGVPVDEVEATVLRAHALLDEADAVLAGAKGSRIAFVGALLVILREGLEAALLLMLLLGYAAKRGGTSARQVHLGWLGAVGLGVVTWLVSDKLIAVVGVGREIVEGAVTLLAAGVLLTAHHWLVGAAEGRRRAEGIKEALSGASGGWTLAVLAFGAAYREAFEVVLFLQAIMLDTAAGPTPVLAGIGVGLALLAVLVVAMLRLGRRIKPGPLLTTASVLLCVMAVIFVGKGLRSFQESGLLSIHPFGGLRVDVLGIYPTVETMAAQLLLTVLLVASAFWPSAATPAKAQMAAK
jgi:high-affinity iron transporter